MKTLFLSAIFITIIILSQSCTQNYGASNATKKTPAVNNLPEFVKVDDFSTVKYLFNQKNDTTYLLNFWATTCPPCLKEIPLFEKILKEKKGKKFKIILFNTDGKKQIEKRVIPYLTKHKLFAKVIAVTDPNATKWTAMVNPDWYGSLPYTVIYKNDKRKYYNESFENYNLLKKEIDEFMQ